MKKYTYTLNIEGMKCGMCETHINDVFRRNFNIKSVKSSHFDNQTIVVTNEELDEEKIANLIKETGYELKGINRVEEEEKEGLFKRLFKKK